MVGCVLAYLFGIIKYPEVAHQVVGESAEVAPFHLHVGGQTAAVAHSLP